MDDFQPVLGGYTGLWPRTARNDLAVVLYGYAVSLQSKFGNHQVKAGWL
jgi:hypothetical protein